MSSSSPLQPMIPVPDAIKIVLTETTRSIWYERQREIIITESSSSTLASTTTTSSEHHHHHLTTPQQLLGRISSHDIVAPAPGYPAYNLSIMDGYAIKTSDLLTAAQEWYKKNQLNTISFPLDFVIIGKVYAGDPDVAYDEYHYYFDHHRTAVYVTTGAIVPSNYDAVIPVEDTELVSSKKETSCDDDDDNEKNDQLPTKKKMQILPSRIESILQTTKPWTWIRPVGCDIAPGTTILSKGDQIQPVHLALLAQVGVSYDRVQVNKLPRVGVLSTGNELIDNMPYDSQSKTTSKMMTTMMTKNKMHATTTPHHVRGKIPDANRPLLLSQLATYKNCIPVDLGIVGDDDGYENIARSLMDQFWPDTTKEKDSLEDSLEELDVVITTGGVSMGEKDIMEQVFVKGMGGRIHFGRLNMKPGKPTTFVTIDKVMNDGHVSRKLVFALPGNPVSASVCAELLARPCLDLLHTGVDTTVIGEKLEEHMFIQYGVMNARVHDEIMATTTSDIELDPSRPEYRRIALTRTSCMEGEGGLQYKYYAKCTGVQRSSRVLSLRDTDGLMILPCARTFDSGNIARSGMEFLVLLYSQTSFSSNTCFKYSIHQHKMWRFNRHDESRQIINMGVIMICNEDEEKDDSLSSLCTTLVTLFGGDRRVSIVGKACCKLDNLLAEKLHSIINGPRMDGVNLIMVIALSISSVKSDAPPLFKIGLDVAHALRPALSKDARAMAMKVRSGAASEDPMAALFENIVGTARNNSSFLVTCTDIGLSGAVHAINGLIDHLVNNVLE